MDRLEFLSSIHNIDYPEMIAKYYDQFLALKDLLQGINNNTSVVSSTERTITFSSILDNSKDLDMIINRISSCSSLNVYGRPISVIINGTNDTEINYTIQ